MSRKKQKRTAERRESHPSEAVAAHVRARHPRCPEEIVEAIVQRASARRWNPPVTLASAVGRIMSAYVRHQLTDYDQLLHMRIGLTQEEARLIVGDQVNDIIKGWGHPAAGGDDPRETDPEPEGAAAIPAAKEDDLS